jgi:peptidase M28-like protein/PDZ domain-containing protein/PA domain-containing protein
MTKRLTLLAAAAALSLLLPLARLDAQTNGTRAHVAALAGNGAEGRLTGSKGEQVASDYLVAQLKRIGARPLPGRSDYVMPFEFTAGASDGGSVVLMEKAGSRNVAAGNAGNTVRALSFSDDGIVKAPIVFAGYGIVVPESQNFGYDSYATLDVKDKVVLVLRYFPEDADQKTKAILARYSDLRYKAMAARQRGAKALLVVTGPNSPNAGELIPMSFDTALAGSGIVAASIDGAIGNEIFATMGDASKTLAAAQKALDSANPHVAGFEIPGATITVTTKVRREKKTGHNVVAYLPATTPPGSLQKPWIALGAHYDHLGHGENGNSLADKTEVGKTHYGADDNASGSAAVLAAGEALSKESQRRRNVLLEFWSGEEIGLIGSAAYVNTPPVPIDQLAAYFNFDMVGRMQDNKLTVQAAGSSDTWARMIEQANVAAGFDLLVQADPYQPTDVSSFYQAGVPSLNFFTGTHTDYHRPSDTADKINYEDLDRVVSFATAIARRVGNADEAPAYAKVQQETQGGARAGVRVFTGTIPDYSTEVKGLLLSGVIDGGPAAEAGLQKGDVIVEIAGQTIANIYDYTYALEVLKIGEPTKVVYMRGTERKETALTPAARK